MEQAMHAAEIVAARSALLALLVGQRCEQPEVDGVTVVLSWDAFMGVSLDVTYTRGGLPVAGEGL